MASKTKLRGELEAASADAHIGWLLYESTDEGRPRDDGRFKKKYLVHHTKEWSGCPVKICKKRWNMTQGEKVDE